MLTNDTDPKSPTPSSSRKDELECQKLQAEIENIRRPFFRTTSFYTAITPAFLAVVGVIITWNSGWFDVQRTKIENQNALIEARTERLKAEQSRLEAEGIAQRAILARSEDEVKTMKHHESELTDQISKLVKDRDELQHNKELLESEIHRLADSDQKASRMLKELSQTQAERDLYFIQREKAEEAKQRLLKTIGKQAAMIRRANDIFSEGTAIILRDKATWEKFAGYNDDVLLFHVASADYLPDWEVMLYANQGASPTSSHDLAVRVEHERQIGKLTRRQAEDIFQEASDKSVIEGREPLQPPPKLQSLQPR